LEAQIAGLERAVAAEGLDARGQADLIELITLRGQVAGRITDLERAEALAEQLTRSAPTDETAFVARARSRATFHRFTDALADLEQAHRLGAEPAVVRAERAAIFQAVGRYDEALTIVQEDATRGDSFVSLGALATLHAERGEVAVAERLFGESRRRYRRVSPFPLAQLDFQRGLMWLGQGDLRRARTWLDAAHRRLPGYAAAEGHLAEVEAAVGETETALDRLRSLTTVSDDPDYSASLARILSEVGRTEEAHRWRARAAHATTNLSRVTRRRSLTTRRNSGLRRVPTPSGRYGWRDGTSMSAGHHGRTNSSLVQRLRRRSAHLALDGRMRRHPHPRSGLMPFLGDSWVHGLRFTRRSESTPAPCGLDPVSPGGQAHSA
jgi:tetratricopeptide (TPR) repeat protein